MNIYPQQFVKFKEIPPSKIHFKNMDKQSLWYLENVDMKGMMCSKKMESGQMDSFNHRTFKKNEYIYMPEESADKSA